MPSHLPDPALEASPVLPMPAKGHAESDRLWQGIPGIERADNGRLWATWYSGGPGEGMWNYVLLYTSDGDGRSWHPVLTIDPPGDVRAFDPCLWRDPTGCLWLFWAQGYGGDRMPGKGNNIWDGRAGVSAMCTAEPGEAHAKWSTPRRLCNGIMMNKPTVTESGAWLLPAAVWRMKAIPEHSFELPEESAANVVGSHDQGRTWTRYGGATVDKPAFDEHMLVERRDKSLWMLLRTDLGIGESESKDGGHTWSVGNPSVFGPLPSARFFIRRLRSGNLLLVRQNPPDHKSRSHLTAYLSSDDGKTWQGGLVVDERNGVSYPDGVETADGTIYLTYDHDRYKAKEILMAVFTEEDVRRGAFASKQARPRVLIDKAAGSPGKQP